MTEYQVEEYLNEVAQEIQNRYDIDDDRLFSCVDYHIDDLIDYGMDGVSPADAVRYIAPDGKLKWSS